MTKLQELLDARWPLSDKLNESDNLDYKMQRSAFSSGYNAAIQAGENPVNEYENTFFFSISNNADEKGEVPADLKLEGDGERLMSGLAQKMILHPEIEDFFDLTLALYDKLISDTKNSTNRKS